MQRIAVALLTLGFPMTLSQKDLVCDARKVVGSFYKKHAITLRKKMRKALTLCKQNGFRFYFTAITSLLFTFPSRY